MLSARYEVQAPLGQGAFGEVYKAYDQEIRSVVALKVLRSDIATREIRERFRAEIRTAMKVRHQNVCGLLNYGRDNQVEFIVMDYIDGTDLKGLLNDRGGSLAARDAVDIAIQAARALEAIHKKGIIHRDFKTANLMVDGEGTLKLMDFGIAKNLETEAQLDMTGTGMRLGTPLYMSPEQVEGERVDKRTDLYSLGVVLFELLTGERPFRGTTRSQLDKKILHDPPPLEDHRIPAVLVPVLAKALAKNADMRFQSASEFVEALEQARPRCHSASGNITDAGESANGAESDAAETDVATLRVPEAKLADAVREHLAAPTDDGVDAPTRPAAVEEKRDHKPSPSDAWIAQGGRVRPHGGAAAAAIEQDDIATAFLDTPIPTPVPTDVPTAAADMPSLLGDPIAAGRADTSVPPGDTAGSPGQVSAWPMAQSVERAPEPQALPGPRAVQKPVFAPLVSRRSVVALAAVVAAGCAAWLLIERPTPLSNPVVAPSVAPSSRTTVNTVPTTPPTSAPLSARPSPVPTTNPTQRPPVTTATPFPRPSDRVVIAPPTSPVAPPATTGGMVTSGTLQIDLRGEAKWAIVSIGGKKLGEWPGIPAPQLPPGEYQVVLENNEYRYRIFVTIRPGETRSLSVDLVSQGQPKGGGN